MRFPQFLFENLFQEDFWEGNEIFPLFSGAWPIFPGSRTENVNKPVAFWQNYEQLDCKSPRWDLMEYL